MNALLLSAFCILSDVLFDPAIVLLMDVYRIDLGKHRRVFMISVSSGPAGILDFYPMGDIMSAKDITDFIEFLNRNTLINFFPIPN